MNIADEPVGTDTQRVDDANIVVPPHMLYPLLCTSGTHDHPDGPMLGFVIPEHDAGVDLRQAHTSPERDLDFNITSLSAGGSSGKGRADWHIGHVLGGASAHTDTGVGEYTGDGTINLSVLGGGNNSSGNYESLLIDCGKDDGMNDEEDNVLGRSDNYHLYSGHKNYKWLTNAYNIYTIITATYNCL